MNDYQEKQDQSVNDKSSIDGRTDWTTDRLAKTWTLASITPLQRNRAWKKKDIDSGKQTQNVNIEYIKILPWKRQLFKLRILTKKTFEVQIFGISLKFLCRQSKREKFPSSGYVLPVTKENIEKCQRFKILRTVLWPIFLKTDEFLQFSILF